MNEQEALNQYLTDIRQDVDSSIQSTDELEFKVDAFTRIAAECLIEAGVIEDIVTCYHKKRGMQMNGYWIYEQEARIDIFVTIYNQSSFPKSVSRKECENAYKHAKHCLQMGFKGIHNELEESAEPYDAFSEFFQLREKTPQWRIFLLTDGLVNPQQNPVVSDDQDEGEFQIWDIRRLYRFKSSGENQEPIEIDFVEQFGSGISCLSLTGIELGYEGYLAVIPGDWLADIYEKYGARLLESNVRSFLQARGKVNQGIRDTISDEPHMFFAYNNGITTTAEKIEFEGSKNDRKIKKIRNFQIVNGGQTTASLYHSKKMLTKDLKKTYVQAKISVIPENQLQETVKNISKYANTQNRISNADFHANDPFHVSVETMSRVIWAPATRGSISQTHWFFERARGQYRDAENRERTPARKKQFRYMNPFNQMFTKTDLALFENTWDQLPHIVSTGAQKNFKTFITGAEQKVRTKIEKQEFEHLIAKALLFRKTDDIVKRQNFGAYKRNIVTYTLAWLCHYTAQKINLDQIWSDQDFTPALKESIMRVSKEIHENITNPPHGRNVTEWCKDKKCWGRIKDLKIEVHPDLEKELISTGKSSKYRIPDSPPDEADQEIIKKTREVPFDKWFEISKWAKETKNLQPWQRSIAFSIGRSIKRSGTASIKQAQQGILILKEVKRLGFKL